MKPPRAVSRIQIKNLLFATDFSEASHKALSFALSIARTYGAVIHALHVLTSESYMCTSPEGAAAFAAMENAVQSEMEKVRVRAQLSGVQNEGVVERSVSIWPAIEEAIAKKNADLVVVGTHGRTGISKLLLGSTAELIFRQAKVPVLTIGPSVKMEIHSEGKFRSILFATDLSEEFLSAASFAFSMAEENDAKLVLLRVVEPKEYKNSVFKNSCDKNLSAANILHELHELIPAGADLWCRPEVLLEFGEPASRILEVAQDRKADLIVMGPRNAKGHLATATHLERSTAHKVVIHSACPVLTVRH
jgi:nucleotide-binding universal stress UspA family protein